MHFQEFTALLGNTTQRNPDKIASSGGCSIRLQDRFDINIEWEEQTHSLCLYATLMTIPATGDADWYGLLLRSHLFGAATQGAIFGIHHERNEVMLFKKVDATNLSATEGVVIVASFSQQVTLWTEQLAKQPVTAVG